MRKTNNILSFRMMAERRSRPDVSVIKKFNDMANQGGRIIN